MLPPLGGPPDFEQTAHVACVSGKTQLGGVSIIDTSPSGPPCPWDCEPAPNGDVGINDFLELLAQWAQVGTSCDFGGGGVGITDFLALLANWGPCP